MCVYIYIYIYTHVSTRNNDISSIHNSNVPLALSRGLLAAGFSASPTVYMIHTCEEFAGLAGTRLAQYNLNYLNVF